MNETPNDAKPTTHHFETTEPKVQSSENMAKLVYILYLVGFFFQLSALIGLVIAYVHKNEAPAWLKSHYAYQIKTFWIGLLLIIIGAVSSIILIGYLVLLVWVIWTIIRCIKGFKALNEKVQIA